MTVKEPTDVSSVQRQARKEITTNLHQLNYPLSRVDDNVGCYHTADENVHQEQT